LYSCIVPPHKYPDGSRHNTRYSHVANRQFVSLKTPLPVVECNLGCERRRGAVANWPGAGKDEIAGFDHLTETPHAAAIVSAGPVPGRRLQQ